MTKQYDVIHVQCMINLYQDFYSIPMLLDACIKYYMHCRLSISGRLFKQGFVKRDDTDITEVGSYYTIDLNKWESALSGMIL